MVRQGGFVARPSNALLSPLFCVFLTSLLVGQQKPSQTGSVPTFRSQTRVVLVDVIVADGKGQFVPGLKAEDFTVKEDGKPQRISGFNLQRYEAPRALPALQLPPNQYTNFTQQEPGGAVTILMLDILNTPALAQVNARKAMVEFLRRLPPGQRVGLFVLSDHPRLIQGFTSSSDALIAAGKSLRPDLSILTRPDLTASSTPNNLAGPISQSADPSLPSLEAITSDQRFHLTLVTLNALARGVSGFSGRKNLLWLSGHFPLRLDQQFLTQNRAGFGGAFSADVRETAALLAASQVAVYPVDVGGLTLQAVVLNPALGEAPRAQLPLGGSTDQFAMDDLARETGGKSFYGTNALDEALLHGLQQGSDYYTLAYSPENHNWNGQYRKIEVKVALKGMKLTFRRGYYAMEEKPFTEDDAARALATAMQPLVPVSTMLLIKAQVLPPDNVHKTVRIDYAVDSHDISFSDAPDQRKHAAVDFMSVARDGDFKTAGYSTDTVEADFLPAVYKQIMQTGFPAHQELELKPGTYMLRLGVIDRGSQKIGTVDLPITIAATEPAKK
jgi:VWFA-related protein